MLIAAQESQLAVDQVSDQRARGLAIVRGNDRVIAAVERPLHGALVRWIAAVAIEVWLRPVEREDTAETLQCMCDTRRDDQLAKRTRTELDVDLGM
jgi:hypothetical protein